jgi:hypothetical protein
MNLIGLSRDNRCSMHGTSSTSIAVLDRDNSRFPCFAAAFRFCENAKATYDFNYALHIHKTADGIHNNFALFPKKEMCRILNSIKYLIPFTYHFEENEKDYIVMMHLRGTALQQKGLLMLSRMLFEFPHNMCALDALKVRALGNLDGEDISEYSLVQLYLLFISSMWFSSDECFIANRNVKIKSSKFIQRSLKKHNKKIISNVLNERIARNLLSVSLPGDTVQMDRDFALRTGIYRTNLNIRKEYA